MKEESEGIWPPCFFPKSVSLNPSVRDERKLVFFSTESYLRLMASRSCLSSPRPSDGLI